MKINFQTGLKAPLFLCILSLTLSTQSFAANVGLEDLAHWSIYDAAHQNVVTSTVRCTGIDLSDPAVYAGEQFKVFVSLKNTGKQEESHTIAIYRKDASAPGGKALMSSKQLTLSAGEDKEVTFTLAPENLLVRGQEAPESFVFIVGGQEIEVAYVK